MPVSIRSLLKIAKPRISAPVSRLVADFIMGVFLYVHAMSRPVRGVSVRLNPGPGLIRLAKNEQLWRNLFFFNEFLRARCRLISA